MAQISADTFSYAQSQKLLNRQGFGKRSAAVQQKFVKRWAVWLIFATIMALFYVWSRVQMVQLGYEVTTLKSQTNELNKQISNLDVEIAKLKSPKRLKEIAETELNMHAPVAEQIVIIKPEEIE
ncbi:MAG: cell division protein FtsL [Deltaproteobacteria bacterium CG11_big_fil_rev_8_21_14_0_20_49_13]|nr:MAG: cell division protein FtsL [Deltaproteobacteria bacterium CG11_big_fil_rev_8_21_14_0_20_49_13]